MAVTAYCIIYSLHGNRFRKVNHSHSIALDHFPINHVPLTKKKVVLNGTFDKKMVSKVDRSRHLFSCFTFIDFLFCFVNATRSRASFHNF